ncbi:cytochrome P450, partial [Conidiobolus coronatus NRRL 28638]
TIEQLKNIPLLDMVIKESMRIMTAVSAFPKKSTIISTLSNGLTIPAKTALFLHYWVVHHNPNDFPDPYEFKPERFDDISNEATKNWQPFGTGPRTCKNI